MNGKVYLVGAGPGDPGLITVKGRQCIEDADVVVYDYLINRQFLTFARKDAELIYVGKSGSHHVKEQPDINQLLVDKAQEGNVVTRLKGGDPFVFGRGSEEALALVEAGIPWEVVPGITSAIAAPAYAGIPATHRTVASTIAFVTGHEDPTKETSSIDWARLSVGASTICFYMGVKNLPLIAQQLMQHGRDPKTPVAVIRWGTRTEQETVTGTLETIAQIAEEKQIKPPAMTIVGEVVGLREKLIWFERKPLYGKQIVVTRSRGQAGEFAHRLNELGAGVVEFPTIRVEAAEDDGPLTEAVRSASQFDWLIFTSINAVEYFFGKMQGLGLDGRSLGNLKICSVGKATTRRIAEYFLTVDCQPEKFSAESVLEALQTSGEISGKSFLLPRADIARSLLPEKLSELGGTVTEVIAYRNVLEKPVHTSVEGRLLAGEIDVVTFSSSSTATNFVKLLNCDVSKLNDKTIFASIGPETTRTARELGINVTLEPAEHTISALADAIVEKIGKRNPNGQ